MCSIANIEMVKAHTPHFKWKHTIPSFKAFKDAFQTCPKSQNLAIPLPDIYTREKKTETRIFIET